MLMLCARRLRVATSLTSLAGSMGTGTENTSLLTNVNPVSQVRNDMWIVTSLRHAENRGGAVCEEGSLLRTEDHRPGSKVVGQALSPRSEEHRVGKE